MSASRKLGENEARSLVEEASRIVVAKGRKVIEYAGGAKAKADGEVVGALLGATGNLRAPTLRSGKTLLVGFNEEAFESVFG